MSTVTNETAPSITWAPWPTAEHFFKGQGFKYRLDKVFPLARIDRKATADNPGRLGLARDEKRGEDLYRLACEQTVELPPLTCWYPEGPSGRAVGLDGWHRLFALDKAEFETGWMYVLLEIGPDTADFVARRMNDLLGIGNDRERRMAHAVAHALKHQHLTRDEVAKKFGINTSTFKTEMTIADFRTRFSSAGDLRVPTHDRLTNTALRSILSLRQNEAVTCALVKGLTTLAVVPNGDVIRSVVEAVKAAPKNEAAQLKMVELEIDKLRNLAASRRTPTTNPRGRRSLTNGEMLQRSMTAFSTVLNRILPENTSGKDVFVSETSRKAAREVIKAVKTKLNKLDRDIASE